MSNRLPEIIRPLELVRARARLEGELDIAAMERLKGRLQGNQGRARVRLRFGRDANGCPYIKGRVTASLGLLCQRCLENMQIPVDIAVSLGIIGAAADAERLPGDYEPLLLDETEAVALGALIEDELLLALPIVALHDREDCAMKVAAAESAPGAVEEETHRPFAGLADLIKSR